MERLPRTPAEADKLLALADLLRNAALTVKEEWASEDFSKPLTQDTARVLPSPKLWEAEKIIESAAGAMIELVCEPSQRIQQVLSQYFESRALYITAERKIPDILNEAGEKGVGIDVLASKTRIESKKLGMELLPSPDCWSLAEEIGENVYANNRISEALVNNDGLRAYVQVFNLQQYRASEYLPRYLLGPKGHSYGVAETAMQEAFDIDYPVWDWMAERMPRADLHAKGPAYPSVPDLDNFDLVPDESGLVPRPELQNFARAMVGGGKTSGAAHAFDFPWAELGEATIVDVGGGVGGFALQLLSCYPKLKFVIQDRPEVCKQGETETFPREAPDALSSGRVKFQPHDFFQENPQKGADVYWVRAILHDWSDDYCIKILNGIRTAMAPHSRLLICDPVMNTTFGCPEIPSAPYPLPANYGYHFRYCYNRDLCLMATFNGIERTPAQLKVLFEKAGLKLKKFWDVRSMVGIAEVGL